MRINRLAGVSYIVLLLIGAVLSFTMMFGPSLLLITMICLTANLGFSLVKESRYIVRDETAFGDNRFLIGTIAGVFGMFLIVSAVVGIWVLLF